MKLRTAYENHEKMSDETGLKCMDPSLTQQHQKDECDINLIVRKYTQTGELPTHNMPPLQDDFAGVTSMQEAMDRVVEARTAFMEQPAEVRAQFNNDPAQFVEYCSDPDNMQGMKKLGLLNAEAVHRLDLEEHRAAEQLEKDRQDAEAYRKGSAEKKS